MKRIKDSIVGVICEDQGDFRRGWSTCKKTSMLLTLQK